MSDHSASLSIPATLPLAGANSVQRLEAQPALQAPTTIRYAPSIRRRHEYQCRFPGRALRAKSRVTAARVVHSFGRSPRHRQSKRLGKTARRRYAKSRGIDKGKQLEKIEGHKIGRREPASSRDRMAQYRRIDLNAARSPRPEPRFDFPFRAQPDDLTKTGDEYRRLRHRHSGRVGCELALVSRHVRTSSTSSAMLPCWYSLAAMPDLYPLIRPFLSRLPAEAANALSLRALQRGLGRFVPPPGARAADPAILRQRLWGLDFHNPIGLAAGCDKDGRVPDAMLNLGFGFVEIGTVTPRPQTGNPKPRLFRLEEDRAIINRMGFNNGGLDAVIHRLSRRTRRGVVGVNLGKNRDTDDAAKDYEEGILRAGEVADYLVVNVSSPNTPGLRELQARTALEALLQQLVDARDKTGFQDAATAEDSPRPDRRSAPRHRRGSGRHRYRRANYLQHNR